MKIVTACCDIPVCDSTPSQPKRPTLKKGSSSKYLATHATPPPPPAPGPPPAGTLPYLDHNTYTHIHTYTRITHIMLLLMLCMYWYVCSDMHVVIVAICRLTDVPTFTLEECQSTSPPVGVDTNHRENHLPTEQFQALFSMKKEVRVCCCDSLYAHHNCSIAFCQSDW